MISNPIKKKNLYPWSSSRLNFMSISWTAVRLCWTANRTTQAKPSEFTLFFSLFFFCEAFQWIEAPSIMAAWDLSRWRVLWPIQQGRCNGGWGGAYCTFTGTLTPNVNYPGSLLIITSWIWITPLSSAVSVPLGPRFNIIEPLLLSYSKMDRGLTKHDVCACFSSALLTV